MKQNVKEYVNANKDELFSLLRDLCLIPAPSHFEDRRAEFCKNWLEENGAKGVYIDQAKNVIFPLNCEGSASITVMAAHTDTVFPDTEPMPYVEDGEILRCPGIGDDTANVAVLMLTAKYMIESGIRPAGGILFVCNSCEEGLGNLKGCRQIFKDYEGRVKQFVSFDGYFCELSDRCVGSHRYEVEVTTQGGHSWSKFGRKNAIAELAAMIGRIYAIEVPHVGESRTTYNVGTVEGGTSINTIAQSAKMFCEYRSDNETCLATMEEHFKRIFAEAENEEVHVSVNRVGERPCMGKVDLDAIAHMGDVIRGIVKETTGICPVPTAMSTDCNIPFSLGIPAIMIGVCEGGGAHTREEWIRKDTFPLGLEVGIKIALAFTEESV